MTHVFGIIKYQFGINGCMSVNKLWTLIYNNQEDRVSTFGLVYQ